MKSEPQVAARLRRWLGRRRSWKPTWTLPPEPQGNDEPFVKDFYYQHFLDRGTSAGKSWRQLEEWQRESWRREYRATPVNQGGGRMATWGDL